MKRSISSVRVWLAIAALVVATAKKAPVGRCTGKFDVADLVSRLTNAQRSPLRVYSNVVGPHIKYSSYSDRGNEVTDFLVHRGAQHVLFPVNLGHNNSRKSSPIAASASFLFVTTEYTAVATIERLVDAAPVEDETERGGNGGATENFLHGAFTTTADIRRADVVFRLESDPYPGQGSGFDVHFNRTNLVSAANSGGKPAVWGPGLRAQCSKVRSSNRVAELRQVRCAVVLSLTLTMKLISHTIRCNVDIVQAGTSSTGGRRAHCVRSWPLNGCDGVRRCHPVCPRYHGATSGAVHGGIQSSWRCTVAVLSLIHI